MAKIIVGLSMKRPGPEQFSSEGFSLGAELETEVGDSEEFRASAQSLFAEVKAALDAEVEGADGDEIQEAPVVRTDIWGGKVPQPADKKADAPVTDNEPKGNGSQPITNKQAKYLFLLASRADLKTQKDVNAWLGESIGVDRGVYDLTKSEASRAIDLLNNGGNGR